MVRMISGKHHVQTTNLPDEDEPKAPSPVIQFSPESACNQSPLHKRICGKSTASLRPLSITSASLSVAEGNLAGQPSLVLATGIRTSTSGSSETSGDCHSSWSANVLDEPAESLANSCLYPVIDLNFTDNADNLDDAAIKAMPLADVLGEEQLEPESDSVVHLQTLCQGFGDVSGVQTLGMQWQCPMINCEFFRLVTNLKHDQEDIVDHIGSHTNTILERLQLVKDAAGVGVSTSALTRKLNAEAKMWHEALKARNSRK